MKIILLNDVKNVGKRGETKEVSDGYARNFLIRRGLAVAATSTSISVLNKQKKEEALMQAELKKQAEELAFKLKDIELVFNVKAKAGKVFNSVSAKKIEEALALKGIKIDKRKIIDFEPITTLGTTNVQIELYKDVIGTVKVKLIEE